MHGNLPAPSPPAIKAAAQTGDDFCPNGQEWFSPAAQAILGKDAGLALHYLTDVPERSCYRYASGERELPSPVLRLIVHHQQGEPFFRAFMHGSTAQWWLDLQRYERMGRAAENAR